MSLGSWVLSEREKRDMSQRQLAAKVGIGNATLARIERLGEVSAHDHVIIRFAETFGVSPVRVLYESGRFEITKEMSDITDKWQALSAEEKEEWLKCYPKKD